MVVKILAYCILVSFLASLAGADEVIIQVFSKKPVNYISEKYISYSVDPAELLEMSTDKQDNFVYRMLESGPCFVKIFGNHTNQMRLDGGSIDMASTRFTLSQLKDIYDVLQTAGIKPVIALPYDPKDWDTHNVMRILGKVSKLEMNDIIWQLGADFHSKDAISYIDDLNTLKLIVGAFANNTKNWSVVGSDITVGSSIEEVRVYSEFSKLIVDAIGWSQSIDLSFSDENIDDFFASLNIDPALRVILGGDSPAWLSLSQKWADIKNPLTHMKQGLNWAQILGDAARNGFKAIFMPITKQTLLDDSISYYTTLLHKRIIGQTVFDTKIFNGNRFDVHFYAHCTKNMSGSFSVFGVNAADTSMDVTARLPFLSGTEYMEFILTVGINGKVYLNDAEIVEPAILTPVKKYKLPGKGATFVMPAHSVAFWVFTDASIPECASVEPISFETLQSVERSSSERLLQQLIIETVSKEERNVVQESDAEVSEDNEINRQPANQRVRRDVNNIDKKTEYNAIELNEVDSKAEARDKRFIHDTKKINQIYNKFDDMKMKKKAYNGRRMKRDISLLRTLLDKFEQSKPKFMFTKPATNHGPRSLIPTITTVHDIFNPGSIEKKIFDPVENPNLPTGDVHFEMAQQEGLNDYAEAVKAGNQVVAQPGEAVIPLNPNPSPEVYSTVAVAPIQSSVKPSFGELSEMNVRPVMVTAAPPAPPLPSQAQTIQYQLPFVVKQLPPTWRVNLQNMEKTRTNLRENLWPMSVQNSPISAILPNVANQEPIYFESRRRRRRAVNSRMNEEIENRVQYAEAVRRENAVSNTELLDKILHLMNEIEHNNLMKSDAQLRKSSQTEESESGPSKKCKVLSMAMEQQCLQTENRPRPLFKRAVERKWKMPQEQPLKRLVSTIKNVFKKPLKFRARRSVDAALEAKSIENLILKEFNEHRQDERDIQKLRYMDKIAQLTTSTQSATPQLPTVQSAAASSSRKANNLPQGTSPATATTVATARRADNVAARPNERNARQLMRSMKGFITGITKAVLQQVSRFWYELS